MTRNLKALGLALVAVFAMSAMAASASSASVLTSDGPFTLTGTETGSETNFLKAFNVKTKCTSTYKGTAVGGGNLASGATTATLTPTYTGCTTAGLPTTVDLNGCDFVLHLGAAGAVTGDQVCPAGNDITVTVFFSAADHTANKPFCTLHIAPANNQGLGGATLSNHVGSSPKDLDLTGAFTGVHVVSTDPGTHPLFCPGEGTETTKTAELAVDVTVKGDKESSATATEVSIS